MQRYIPVALRRLVRERAGERCEYCLIPEQLTLAAHWVDHIVAEKHGLDDCIERSPVQLVPSRVGLDNSVVEPAS